jgi:hypothetical protein
LAIDDASTVLSKIEIVAWGPTLNKHHGAVLAALGANDILGARFATGLLRESNLHIPDDQYRNESTAVLAPASKHTLELQSGRNSGYAYRTYRASQRRPPNTWKNTVITKTASLIVDNIRYPRSFSSDQTAAIHSLIGNWTRFWARKMLVDGVINVAGHGVPTGHCVPGHGRNGVVLLSTVARVVKRRTPTQTLKVMS